METIEEGQKFGYISTFEFKLSGNLEMHIFENADVDWLHCIAAHRKKKCSLKLNVKWQSMISLIDSMKKDPGITVKEPAVKTGLTEDGVRYHMNKMRRAGILVREGSTKAGKWIVKEL